MAKIDPNSLKNWNNGQVMHESEYEQERTIIVTAINANDDQIKTVDAKHVGNAAELDEKIEQKADEIRVYVDQKKVKTSDIEDEAVTTDKVAPGLREDKIELDYPTGQIAQRLAQLEQGDIFAALKGLVVKTYTTTATANQDVFDVSSIGTVAPGNVITFNIDGVPQFGAFEVANATTIEIPDPCVGGEEVIIQWIGSSESGGDGGIETFSSAELITARGGYARLNDRLNAMSPPTFSMPEYKTTATAGQTVFDVSSVGSFAQNQKRILAFNIDGYPQVNYVETSSTKLTIASPCVGGESVFIKFLMGDSIPLVSGHGRAHRKGGADAININELEGAEDFAVRFDRDVNVKAHGAVGDGVTDDTAAFQAAIDACNYRRKLYIPSGKYRITGTLYPDACRGFVGEAVYTGEDEEGVLISFDPGTITDLIPCIDIRQNAYGNTVYENFTIFGPEDYSTANLGSILNHTYFADSDYRMFPAGAVAIRVSGNSKPTFRNVSTGFVKVGALYDSTDGHITSYDCNWKGLIGVYVRKNSGDYFFQGGGITGAFCGLMLGIQEWVGHYGGCEMTINRVHFGFCPYGIYQVKDALNYSSLNYVGGINGDIKTARFESIGEAAIKMLNKSLSVGLHISGFGFSWDPAFRIPFKSTVAEYAVVFGYLGQALIEDWDGGAVSSFGEVGSLGSAYIDTLMDGSVITGLGDEVVFGWRDVKAPILTSIPAVEEALSSKTLMPLSAGNICDAEVTGRWEAEGSTGATVSLVTTGYPAPNAAFSKFLGTVENVIRVVPNGSQSPYIYQQFSGIPMNGRPPVMQFFIYSPTSLKVRARLEMGNWEYLYDNEYEIPANQWTRITAKNAELGNDLLHRIAIFGLATTGNTYIAGVMVSPDYLAAYSPTSYPYTNSALGASKGFVTRDIVTGTKYVIRMESGAQVIRPWDDEDDDVGAPLGSAARIIQGSYVGNGAAGARTISLPGILPKLIYLTGLGVSTNYVAVIAMPGAETHMGQGANNSSTSAGPYQTSSDSVPKAVTGGFTVAGITNGTDLNVSGRTYHYTVIY